MAKDHFDTFASFQDRRVTVMGLGRFGGGVAVTRFLIERGAMVTLTDLANEAALSASLQALEPFRPARLVLGRHEETDFQNADLIVVNPAVRPDNPFLKIAEKAGVPRSSEMNLFWRFHRGKTVAVTGSNGKSTTAAMVHAILDRTGFRARLGGNIGQSLLNKVEHITPDDWTVLELSSFQLADLGRIKARPDVAVVTNFSPNHLDWHGALAEYRAAKQNVLRWQTAEDAAVLNVDDPEVSRWPTAARRLGFGEHDPGGPGVFAESSTSSVWRWRMDGREASVPLGDWLKIPGRHNQTNAAAAITAALSAGANLAAAEAALREFHGLPHRLELLTETAGRRFYNDSIATTPESVAVALEAFFEPIVLLAGGSDKGIDLRGLAESIARRAKAVALMGETASLLQKHLQDLGFPASAMRVCASLSEAFAWAGAQSQPGDVVLLSPGCASYDWFQNFADRGEQFARLAKSWKPAKP